MPKPYGYTWEKLFTALIALAQGRGTVRERLPVAMLNAHTVLSESRIEESFPPDARPHARAIVAAMTAVGGPDGAYEASARAMSEDDAVKVARWIRELYFRIHDASGASGADGWMTGSELDPPR